MQQSRPIDRTTALSRPRGRRPGAPGPAAWLHSTASGPAAALRLRAPAPRARPAALTQRLEKLQGALDDRRYAEMVADVTATERRLAALGGELFPTTRLQLSFGAHVLVMMGTFFALGFYGARFVTGSDTWVSGSRAALCMLAGRGMDACEWGRAVLPTCPSF